MRVWLDDIRPMPEGFDYWAKNAYEIVGLILSGNVDYISFDHDLGKFNGEYDLNNTGYRVAEFIERLSNDHHFVLKKIEWDIHSQNPVGADRIRAAMESAERFWK